MVCHIGPCVDFGSSERDPVVPQHYSTIVFGNSRAIAMEPLGLGATEYVSLLAMRGPEANHITEPLVAIVEVAYRFGQYWSIPLETSQMLLQKMRNGEDACYTYDWGEHGRQGSWSPEGEETKINRYMIDFVAMTQTNIDNNRMRSIRIVYVRRQDVEPRFTGQIPDAS